jgi:beta-phosphoglucomutase-like phosphatase (HAD superfamily)
MALTIDPRCYDAVVFHLDGVVTDTACIDAAAWTQFFDGYLAGSSMKSCKVLNLR